MSAHLTFVSAAAVSFTVPSAAGEFEGRLNRRITTDLTGRVRARIAGRGGGTNAAAPSVLAVQYTTDLTGATGWAYLDGDSGPYISVSNVQNNPAHHSPWFTITPAARGVVLLRIVGSGGDGATTTCTISHFIVEVAGPARWESQSLENVGGTPGEFVAFGGSQIAGGGTTGTDAGEFGELPVPLRAIPAGMTVIRNGVTLAVFDHTSHGIEAGFAAELADQGRAAGVTLVCRYVASTVAADWTDTHLATLAADVAAADIDPCLAFYVGGGNEGNSLTTVGDYDRQQVRLIGAVGAQLPGCGLATMGQVTQDPGENGFLPEAREVLELRMSDTASGQQCWVDWTGIELQADNRHPTSAGTVAMGRRLAQLAIDAGLV